MNLTDVQLALRTQALTLSVATTGSTSLSATATGYARAAGSFVTDGFLAGMEILPTGFTTNTPRVIQSVAATAITARTAQGSVPIEAAAAGRTLVCGIPAIRAYDNQRAELLADRWAIEEEFRVQPGRLRSMAATNTNGVVSRQGLYILRPYAVEGAGMAALLRWVDDLLALFPGESTLAVTGGDTVRVRGDLLPFVEGPFRTQSGWVQSVVTIPWWMLTLNQ